MPLFHSGSLRYVAPVLFAIGAMNTFTASLQGDLVSISTALCLCLCAAGLFVASQKQRDLLLGQKILAWVANHPEVTAGQVARAVSCSTPTAQVGLERLTNEGFLSHRELHGGVRRYSLPA
ncbi:MarR family transcriptional regulator [Streptomyces hydrogenans]|uniref:MarR family transcriptional regulator n=1 Tax=Streptomyces hydrogenans TaxID=1873719 RepID=UPI00364BCE53